MSEGQGKKNLDIKPKKWHHRHAKKIRVGFGLASLITLGYFCLAAILDIGFFTKHALSANPGDITGTIYLNEGATDPIEANKTVALSVNGGTKNTVETNAAGQFTFTSSPLNAGDVVAIFLDDETEKASYIFLAQGASYMENVTLFTNNIKLGHFNAGPITNANLDVADNVNDSDLGVTVTGTSANFFASGLQLWIRAEKTYKPGGAVSAGSTKISGTLNLEANQGTFYAGITISGAMTASGALSVFNGGIAGDGTIDMSAGSLSMESSGNFGGASNWNFNDLSFGGLGGDYTVNKVGSGQITVAGVLTIKATDTLNAGSSIWTLSKSGTPFVLNGTLSPQTSSFVYTGTALTTMAGGTYYDLTVNRIGVTFLFSSALYINHVLTVQSGTLIQSSTIYLNASGTPFVVNGSFVGSGGVLYNGDGDTTVASTNYDTLSVGTGGSMTGSHVYTLGGDVTIKAMIYVGPASGTYSQTLNGADKTITFSNTGNGLDFFPKRALGVFEPATSTVKFQNGAGSYNYTMPNYYNLEVVPTGTAAFSLPPNLQVTNNFVNGNGTNATSSYVSTSAVITNFTNNANAIFDYSDASFSVGSSMTFTPSIISNTTSNLIFTATSQDKTITSNGQVLPPTAFDGVGGVWTLQDDLTASSLTFTKGRLYDNGRTVTVNGSIMIADVANLLTSTGNWIMSGDGYINNFVTDPNYVSNIFNNLTINAGVSVDINQYLNVRKLTIGDSVNLTGSYLHFYPQESNFFVQGEADNIILTNIKIHKNLGTQGVTLEQGKIDAPNTPLMLAYGTGVIYKMTAPWSAASLTIAGGGSDNSEAEATTLDTNGYNLTIGSLTLGLTRTGISNSFYAKILLKTGTHRIIGSLQPYDSSTNATHGYIDFGSSTTYVGGNIVFANITKSGTNSGTVIMDGSAQQTLINTSSVRLNNLKIENASTAGVVFNDGLYLDGTFTNITPSSKMTFKSGAVYYFPAININGGTSNTKITMLSSSNGLRSYFTIPSGTPTVSYVSVRDSSAVGGNTINARTACTDLGNNINWDFGYVPTPTPTPTPTATFITSPTETPTSTETIEQTNTPSPTSTVSASMTTTTTATITPTPSATQTSTGGAIDDPVVTSGDAIVIDVGGKEVILTENDKIRFYDKQPEFSGVTDPYADVYAEIKGKIVLNDKTKANENGVWNLKVSDSLPTGKYDLNLTFKSNGRILGSKSFNFEIGRNYWLDALYVTILLAILISVILLPKRIKAAKIAKPAKIKPALPSNNTFK